MANILVVEDEPLIAMLIEDWLRDMGHCVVGPAATSAAAEALVVLGGIDAAVLDLNIGGGDTVALADRLRAIGVPFVFATAYNGDNAARRFPGVAILAKPYERSELDRAIADMTMPRHINTAA